MAESKLQKSVGFQPPFSSALCQASRKSATRRLCPVPELLIHDLRRTAARNMIRAGVPEKQVLLIVGWKTRAMLDRYNITDERDIQVAGQKLADYLEQKAELAKVRTKVRTAEQAAEERNGKEGLLIQ